MVRLIASWILPYCPAVAIWRPVVSSHNQNSTTVVLILCLSGFSATKTSKLLGLEVPCDRNINLYSFSIVSVKPSVCLPSRRLQGGGQLHHLCQQHHRHRAINLHPTLRLRSLRKRKRNGSGPSGIDSAKREKAVLSRPKRRTCLRSIYGRS